MDDSMGMSGGSGGGGGGGSGGGGSSGGGSSGGIDALKGKTATVLEQVDSRGGRIKLAGEIWSARSLDPDQVYEAGREVDVVEIDGATALVM